MGLLKALCVIGGGLVAGAAAVVAFPIVAPLAGAAGLLGLSGTGTAIATLGGASLASASTAVITGTIAGSTAVVGAGGSIIGSVSGNAIHKRLEHNQRLKGLSGKSYFKNLKV